jgi:outer membrane lipoprotein SlyB
MRNPTHKNVALLGAALSLAVLAGCNGRPIADASAADDRAPVIAAADRDDDRRRDEDRDDCINCGTVESITPVRRGDGDSTGVGAVVGAIVGGVAGHQVGGGRGQDIATVAGAVGGAVAGNKIEEARDKELMYDVVIDMERGEDEVITVSEASSLRVGDEVTVRGNEISLR